jgi:hypothetical protein
MDRDDEVKRAQRAQAILNDPLWIEAWETYRLKVFASIENAKTDEGTLRGKLMLGVANDVRGHFEGLVRTGKAAAHEIKLEEEEKQRKSLWSRVTQS